MHYINNLDLNYMKKIKKFLNHVKLDGLHGITVLHKFFSNGNPLKYFFKMSLS